MAMSFPGIPPAEVKRLSEFMESTAVELLVLTRQLCMGSLTRAEFMAEADKLNDLADKEVDTVPGLRDRLEEALSKIPPFQAKSRTRTRCAPRLI